MKICKICLAAAENVMSLHTTLLRIRFRLKEALESKNYAHEAVQALLDEKIDLFLVWCRLFFDLDRMMHWVYLIHFNSCRTHKCIFTIKYLMKCTTQVLNFISGFCMKGSMTFLAD